MISNDIHVYSRYRIFEHNLKHHRLSYLSDLFTSVHGRKNRGIQRIPSSHCTAVTISMKEGFKEAPPTKNPSMFGFAMSSFRSGHCDVLELWELTFAKNTFFAAQSILTGRFFFVTSGSN